MPRPLHPLKQRSRAYLARRQMEEENKQLVAASASQPIPSIQPLFDAATMTKIIDDFKKEHATTHENQCTFAIGGMPVQDSMLTIEAMAVLSHLLKTCPDMFD